MNTDIPNQIPIGPTYQGQPLEIQHQLRRTEQALEAKRKEAAELWLAFDQASPQEASRFIRRNNEPLRYNIIDRIISLATEIAATWQDADGEYHHIAELLEDLTEAVDQNENYWTHIDTLRQKVKAATKKATNSRTANVAVTDKELSLGS